MGEARQRQVGSVGVAEGSPRSSRRKYGGKDDDSARDFASYVHSFLWISASGFLIYHMQLPQVVQYDIRVNRLFLALGVSMFAVIASIFLYLVVVLPIFFGVKNKEKDYLKTNPTSIYVATACSVASYFIFVIAFWPVWSWITPLIFFVLMIGMLFAVSVLFEVFGVCF